ncbi:MAG: peptide ABC transporter substrate-binding protein [Chloroflexi bacterium]|nr:peptide ABC transporter substrate-binding protein [Chloroflexota bacterium]
MVTDRVLRPNHTFYLIISFASSAMLATAVPWSLEPLSFAAPGQLALTSTPIPTPTPGPPPTFTGVYRNTTEGFSLVLPQGWEGQETGDRAPTLVIQNPSQTLDAEIWIFPLLDPQPAEEWLREAVAGYGEVTITRESSVQLGLDTGGYQAVFGWAAEAGLQVREHWTAIVRGTQLFLIRVVTPAAEYDRLAGAINAFASSFTLEAPAPFGASQDDSLFLAGGEILTLDPPLYRGSPAGVPGAIFSGLVRLDRELRVVPDIAGDWEVTGGGTVYTFHLRPDVLFHDGKQLTAHDFKYAWERAADPAIESPTARTYLGDILGVKEKLDGEATEITGLQVLDDLTLRVTIDAPKPYFLQKLAYPTAYVVDRNNVESGDDWTDAPNGTGPFKLKVWEKDELLVLERNEQYYGGVPELAHVVYRLFAGRPMIMYEQGEIDLVPVFTSNIERAQDPANPLSNGLEVATQFCTSYLAFNVTMPPFDDPKVRQAFALALDIDKLLAVSLKGMPDRASSIVPPDMPGHNPSLSPVPFDPSQARALLEQSRYGGAENLPVIVSFTHDDAFHWMWQEYLGVEVEAVSLPEPQDYLDRRDAKELPLEATGWCADYPDPQNFLEVLFHSESDENHFGYSNPEVDSLLEEAAVEPDHEARMALYQEIERRILDDWVAVPLWHNRSYVLVRPYVKGYELSAIGIPILQDLSIER